MTDANQEYTLGGFGSRLKTAREALNLSQKEAAVQLHLSPNILEILESENFQKAPPATFMRGYLRSYARLLNFNEEDVKSALTQSGLESCTSAPIVPTLPTETMQISDRYVQWISTSVVLGLFIFVGIWWGFHSSSSNNNTLARDTTSQPQIAQPIQPAAPPVPMTVVTGNVNVPVAQQAPAAAQSTVTQPTVATTAQPVPVSGNTAAPNVVPPNVNNNAAPAFANGVPVPPAIAAPNTAPTAIAGTPSLDGTGVQIPPGTDPIAAPGSLQPANPAMASGEAPKKHASQRRKQDTNVSGFNMELPEPGL